MAAAISRPGGVSPDDGERRDRSVLHAEPPRVDRSHAAAWTAQPAERRAADRLSADGRTHAELVSNPSRRRAEAFGSATPIGTAAPGIDPGAVPAATHIVRPPARRDGGAGLPAPDRPRRARPDGTSASLGRGDVQWRGPDRGGAGLALRTRLRSAR